MLMLVANSLVDQMPFVSLPTTNPHASALKVTPEILMKVVKSKDAFMVANLIQIANQATFVY